MAAPIEERICHELKRIADYLEKFLPEPEPTPAPEPMICPHPIESRIDLGMTAGVQQWACRLCQYQTPEPS